MLLLTLGSAIYESAIRFSVFLCSYIAAPILYALSCKLSHTLLWRHVIHPDLLLAEIKMRGERGRSRRKKKKRRKRRSEKEGEGCFEAVVYIQSRGGSQVTNGSQILIIIFICMYIYILYVYTYVCILILWTNALAVIFLNP